MEAKLILKYRNNLLECKQDENSKLVRLLETKKEVTNRLNQSNYGIFNRKYWLEKLSAINDSIDYFEKVIGNIDTELEKLTKG
jgi:hypothetical protein